MPHKTSVPARLQLNKSVFGFLRRLTTWHCPHLAAAAAPLLLTAGRAAISFYAAFSQLAGVKAGMSPLPGGR